MKNLKMYADLAKHLELNEQTQHEMTSSIVNYIEQFMSKTNSSKAFYANKTLPHNFFDVRTFTQKWSMEEIISFFENVVDKNGLNSTSGGYLGYIPGGGLYPTALADYIAAATNRFPTYYDISPPAVELENMAVKWLCQLIGYPETAGGCLTSGGSSANLIGLHAARNHHNLKGADFAKTVVYLTIHAHRSVQKALNVIGLNEAVVKLIPVDEHFHMDAHFLENEVQNDIKNNLSPWIVISAAGTTNVGSVDPIEQISEIAQKYGLWHHIDAAYGGFFMLTEHGKKLFKYIKMADSVILDPHKSLFLSYGSGAVLVKDRNILLKTYLCNSDYLPNDENSEHDQISPCNLGFELTRNFRALRLWLPMKIFGIEPFRAALEEKLLLAEYFYNEVQKIPGIEVACKPDLSIVAFRYVPKNGDAEKFNNELVESMKNDGRILLSPTFLHKKMFIRVACVSYKTHLEHIDLTLKIVREGINRLEVG